MCWLIIHTKVYRVQVLCFIGKLCTYMYFLKKSSPPRILPREGGVHDRAWGNPGLVRHAPTYQREPAPKKGPQGKSVQASGSSCIFSELILNFHHFVYTLVQIQSVFPLSFPFSLSHNHALYTLHSSSPSKAKLINIKFGRQLERAFERPKLVKSCYIDFTLEDNIFRMER